MIVNRLFEIFNPGHGGKRKRRDLSFRQKMVLLKWMDHPYPRGNYNFSEISRNKIPGQKDSKQIAITSACYRQ